MGTLFNQSPRQDSLHKHYVNDVGRVLRDDMGLDSSKASPAQWHAACDIARTALAVQSADVLDEQLAGFGELLQRLIEVLDDLKGVKK